eukprot:TRINITY_DN73452_c0_g1_i1.p1 TRINITY_DN73452_c0_g1~~TRINITY_DN73452_c0_g1_i1.p1  ORF type:complete len:241 (-),score=49.14 TRINITY_DN73452_c0_g1_i1:138-830(-)
MAPGMPERPRLRRKSLLGLLLLVVGSVVPTELLGGARSFVAGLSPSATPLRPRGLPDSCWRPSLHASSVGSVDNVEGKQEMSDLEKLIDRFSTKGGIILATTAGLLFGFVLEKFLELFMEWQKAGVGVTIFYSVGLFVWVGQYLWRVDNKQTTYANQLQQYEQQVMVKRFSELDEEEIDALCEEVGVAVKDLDEVLGEQAKNMTKKEKVVKLFQQTTMKPKDLRAGGFFE